MSVIHLCVSIYLKKQTRKMHLVLHHSSPNYEETSVFFFTHSGFSICIPQKFILHRASEVARWINAYAIKPDDLSSTPRTHMVNSQLLSSGLYIWCHMGT